MPFGGDYNPEQWPKQTWTEDVELMQQAGVVLVTVGVFSWAHLQTGPDRFEFGWLDEIMDLMHEAGIAVDLATATASPPPWLTRLHPEILPVTESGIRVSPGGRQAFCPSSPVFAEFSLDLCRRLAQRYAGHPALAMWHVSNELGCHNARCYCDVSAGAFRDWLRARYADDLDRLNHAWGTSFWSQRYTDFEEILPPRTAYAFANPTHKLDFHRFSSDQLIANFVAERDLLHEISPGVPVTTNFMVTDHIRDIDYFAFAREVDIVTNDHYLVAARPDAHAELAFCADLTRGLAGGKPWLLMETSTSAVNWQPRNVAKRPGELLRNAMGHVSRGSDGMLFFQWRASAAGAEKFHSALVPHAGTNTRIWREVVALSGHLDRLEGVAGSTCRNDVALLFDWNSWWASELDAHPSSSLKYLDRLHDLHRSLTAFGVGVDVVHPESDLSGYRLVVVPTLYLVTDAAQARIAEAVAAGTDLLVTYFSGIVDEFDHIRLGGYPGAFRDLLGAWVEEFTPLRVEEQVHLDNGWSAGLWAEIVHLEGAEVLATYADGPAAGHPAITRWQQDGSTRWYVSTRLEPGATDQLLGQVLDAAGVHRWSSTRPGLEVVHREDDTSRWTFVINHTDSEVDLPVTGIDLLTNTVVDGTTRLAPGAVSVVRSR